MKKLLLLLLVALAGCEGSRFNPSPEQEAGVRVLYMGGTYAFVIKVDSCEYVVINDVKGVAMIHKANCSNHK
jgi:hypothetical protein